MEDTPGSLPAGWITEIKTHKSGSKAGTHYKCYIDPLTGKKFYSKKGVFRFLESRDCDNGKPEPEEEAINAPCPENIQSSPDFLPPGWIKEIKFRKNKQGVGYRKDPYYTDPVTGHVFRSKVEVFRYLKTGVLGKHTRKRDQRNVSSMQSVADETSFPIVVKRQRHAVAKRRLFNGNISASDGPKSNRTSRSCSVSHDSTDCSKRRQSERIQAAQLLKKQSPELDDGNQPSDLLDQLLKKQSSELEDGNQPSNLLEELFEKQSPELDDGNQPSDLLQQQLLKKQSPELEDRNQPLEEQLLKKQLPVLEDGNQPSDLLENQSQLASLEKQNYQQGGLPLKLKDNKPLKNVVAMESEDRKLVANGWPSGSDEKLSKDVGPSEGKKHTGSQLPLESVHGSRSEHGSSSKLQYKLLEHNQLLKSGGEKISDNGDLSKLVDVNQMLKGLFCESKEEDQIDTTEKVSNSENPLADQSSNAKNSPLESEDNKQLHDETGKPKAKSTKIHPRKRKAEKAPVFPRRASKRLAGLEADPSLNFENPDHACRQAAKKQTVSATPASVATEECQPGMANDGKPVVIEMRRAAIIEQAGSAPPASISTEECQPGKANNGDPVMVAAERAATIETEKPSSHKAEKSMDKGKLQSLVSPFGDSWPDPCLEFAFKTLTGEISMDTLGVGDYFQQQLGGDQFSKPSL